MSESPKKGLVTDEGLLRVENPEDRKKITAITTRLVLGMIREGELDPLDNPAIEKAAKEMALVAHTSYYAALEHLSG